jgi:hypothetical protein
MKKKRMKDKDKRNYRDKKNKDRLNYKDNNKKNKIEESKKD